MMLSDCAYEVYDVGGTRVQRKHWIHYFKASTAVLFVVDISAYDLRLLEDQSMSRIEEDLVLFDSICNSAWIEGRLIGLFFTKMDILRRKLSTSSVKDYLLDFHGDETDIEAVKTHFSNMFLALNKDIKRGIKVYYTSITDLDTGVGEAAFDFVRKNTVFENLANTRDTNSGWQATADATYSIVDPKSVEHRASEPNHQHHHTQLCMRASPTSGFM